MAVRAGVYVPAPPLPYPALPDRKTPEGGAGSGSIGAWRWGRFLRGWGRHKRAPAGVARAAVVGSC